MGATAGAGRDLMRPTMVSRRKFLHTTAVGALANGLIRATRPASAAPARGQTPPAPKPNIVFILMDNLGYGEVGCYGGGIVRGAPTPAREGFPVFVADRLEAVKWKNWKIVFYDDERDWFTPPAKLGGVKLFDLITDPKEEYPGTGV